jgi:RNA polymerase sigma-70 factor (ECF subfamily)
MTTSKDQASDIQEQLVAVFREHQAQLVGTVRHLLGWRTHPEDLQEVLQQAFLGCWRRRRRLTGVEDLRGFVVVAVLNAGRDHLRRRRRRREVPLGDPATLEARMAPVTTPPTEALERQEALIRVREAIGLLHPREREVFLLRQNGELTYEAIAVALEIPVGTAKTRMRRALQHLRAALTAPAPERSAP